MGRQDLNFESVGASMEQSQSLLYFQPVRRPQLGGRGEGSLAPDLKNFIALHRMRIGTALRLILSFYSK